MERTVALIKPDAVQRGLVGTIYNLLERCSDPAEVYHVDCMRMLYPDVNFPGPGFWNPRQFYARQHEDKHYFQDLVNQMSSGPSIAMVLSGPTIIADWRAMMTLIRKTLQHPQDHPSRNLVHGSDSAESYEWERRCLVL